MNFGFRSKSRGHRPRAPREPKEFDDRQLKLRGDGGFYCPNGHRQVYIGKSKEQKLEEKLKYTKKRLDEEISCCLSAREEANHLEKKVWGYKGYATKLKRQISAESNSE